ncbi:M4 family metallopeptidase [Archangium sp.]|uniref:M4 family metallopeptidase n=1 Tax=Archangium sp. TaxID=1872627 RepID=UPI002D41D8C1|nr:M4 family metallopeptidase [Archangium sp.]HYO52946.1 M4 family metallopeptidase [Archangium sp.]
MSKHLQHPHSHRACRCYIIPPHILDHLAKHSDPQVRGAGITSQFATHALRQKRTLLVEGFRPSRPTGGLRRTIYDAGQTPSPGHLVRSEGQAAVADITVNEAYDASGATYKFYKEVFSRNSVDDRGHQLDSTVHYREDPAEPFDNAFWDGEQMIYGDGDGIIFGSFTKSLDVIAHELTHGVTQFSAGLEYHDQPGALNESMSDVFGSMAKQWTLKQTVSSADWLIGAELLIAPHQALRSMKAPGTAYDNPDLGKDPQPDRMSKYLHLPNTRRGDNGGVHINSGIPNRAFYLACVNLGAAHSWEKAGKIWYAVLTTRLSTTASFVDAANATVSVANELFGTTEAKAVRDAWQQVEVLPASPAVANVA